MSISSLGRAIVAPSLREPVSPLNNTSRAKVTNTTPDLQKTQVTTETSKAQDGRADVGARAQGRPQHLAPSKPRDLSPEESPVRKSADNLAEMLRRDRFGLEPSGPLSRPDFRVIDQVNNIDFERAIPPEALRERIFELREDFIAELAQDTISFDSTSPFGRRVIVIREQLNEREFVRHIPSAYNENRFSYLSSFASERGFDFEATA